MAVRTVSRRQLALKAAVLVAQTLLARQMGRTVTHKASDDTRQVLLDRLPAARTLYRQMQREASRSDKATLDGLPRPLRWLIQQLIDAIGEWFADLLGRDMSLAEWYSAMRDGLAEYHLAAFMTGNKSEAVSEQALERVAEQVNVQLDYLKDFKVELQAQPPAEYAAGAQARAESYAAAIKVPYWTGRTKLLPLPAMPTQGVTCLGNCKCLWRVVTLDEAAGNYDAFWERHAEDSCDICLEREAQWSPVRIRDGMLE